MSEENIAIVRRLTEEGFVGGKIEVIDDLVAENCVDHDPMPEQPAGREGQRGVCQMVVSGLSDRTVANHYLVAAGDTVTESWTFHGTHTGDFMGVPATGRQIEIRGIEIWRCANGKIVERRGVLDTGAVMQQLGVVGE
ncbi:MAG TPA: ester cyclase [Acidimicrobiia bacterium]|nr:ester cyclase [Acidimicrobiia bacterium]